jgi:RNA polymerase-binding transcription factor DksA
MNDDVRLCQKCQQPISAERLEEVPVARLCAKCIRPRPCVRCKEVIPVDRLDAYPESRLCAGCSRETGGDTRLRFSTVNTGKTGSLKRGSTAITGTRIVHREVPPKED